MKIPHDFGYTDEHQLIAQQARRFFRERAGNEAFRALAEDEVGHDPAVYRDLAELGYAGLVLPEEHEGGGLGWLHLALVFEEAGRGLYCGPLLATTVAGVAIALAGSSEQKSRWLPKLGSGEARGAYAWVGRGGSPEAAAAVGTVDDEGKLSGLLEHVVDGASADVLVAPFAGPEGPALYLFERGAEGLSVHDEKNIDPTRRTARLVLDGVAGERLTADVTVIDAIVTRATLALAAEMVGAAESALLVTRDYALVREQFGRKIGSFQGVKHPLVDMMIGIESARSLVYGAAAALDAGGHDGPVLVRMAKAMASDVFAFGVRKAVQLHGGIGFTWECDVHYYFRRAMWARANLGDAGFHRKRLGQTMLERFA